MWRCDCIQRVVKAPISFIVAPVCVYQHATDVMAATNAETGPTKPTAVSHAQISLDLLVIGNGSVLFCSLAVLDPRVGHTMDVLSPFIPVLCHSD